MKKTPKHSKFEDKCVVSCTNLHLLIWQSCCNFFNGLCPLHFGCEFLIKRRSRIFLLANILIECMKIYFFWWRWFLRPHFRISLVENNGWKVTRPMLPKLVKKCFVNYLLNHNLKLNINFSIGLGSTRGIYLYVILINSKFVSIIISI